MALTLSGVSVPVGTTTLPANTSTKNITLSVQNDGVFDATQGGKEVNIFPLPETLDVTVSSNSATGSGTTRVYLFNQDYLQNVDDNGAGANSITYTWGDGNTGKTYNRLLASSSAGAGIKVYGFNIQITDSEGNAAPSAFTTLDLTQLVSDGSGNTIPVPIKIQMAKRNTAYDQGLFTVKFVTTINVLTQIAFQLPKGLNASFSFFTNPDFE